MVLFTYMEKPQSVRKMLFFVLVPLLSISFFAVSPSAHAENQIGQHITIDELLNTPLVKSFLGDKAPPVIRTSCDASVSRDTASCGRSSVTVDPSYNGENLGWTVFHTIQEAVNAVDDNGTVYVAAGTYTENVTLARGVSLLSSDDYIFEDIGAAFGAPKIVAPDCTALTVENTNFSVVAGFEIDGNDSGHLCSDPLVHVPTETTAIFFFDTFEHSNNALGFDDTTLSLSLFIRFFDNAFAVNNAGTTTLQVFFDSYWDSPSGPTVANNPGGHGQAITGVGASTVLFRPYITEYPLSDSGPVFSSTTVDASDIQTLFSNGGTFFSYFEDSFDDVSQIVVDENVTIEIPSAHGTSSVFIPGYPGFIFTPGYSLVNHADENFDATALSAGSLRVNAVSGIPDNKQVITGIQFGIPGIQLDVDDGDPATVNLYVGNSYNNKVLSVYRSESLHDGWTTDGLVDTSCTVSDGMCSFQTTSFSYFVAVGTRQGGGSSVGGSIYSSSAFIQNNTSKSETGQPVDGTSEIQNVTKDLKFGMTDNDVIILQAFLIAQNKGSASLGLKLHGGTNYFGIYTKDALAEWQKAEGIVPSLGYFGPKTREKIKFLNL